MYYSHLVVKRYSKRLHNRCFSDQQIGDDMVSPKILVAQFSNLVKPLLKLNQPVLQSEALCIQVFRMGSV